MKFPVLFLTLVITPVLLTACLARSAADRTDDAREHAIKAGFTPDHIAAPPFILARFFRITSPDLPVHVYLEGDGAAWISRHEPALNPTPSDPVGLNLALRDPGPNVVYLSRPCQFVALNTPGNDCSVRDWTSHRFGPRVINAYQSALNQIHQSYPQMSFDIIGYSGGAYIALVLAGSRDDIRTIRTVAGNLDNTAFTTLHNISAMPITVPLTGAMRTRLSHIPQRHFVGGDDTTIPKDIALSYQSTLPSAACVQISVVPGVNHSDGWAQNWITFLRDPVLCNGPK